MARNRRRNDVEHAHRTKQCLQLRLAGASYREIAEQVDRSPATVYAIVQEATQAIPAEEADLLRSQEVARLDRLQRAVWGNAIKGDPAAVREAVRIIDRRCRLLGLDMPQQVGVGVGVVDIGAASAAILSELAGVVDGEIVDEADGDTGAVEG